MGFSPAYEIFTGAVEVLGGLLLTTRRTTRLGALFRAPGGRSPGSRMVLSEWSRSNPQGPQSLGEPERIPPSASNRAGGAEPRLRLNSSRSNASAVTVKSRAKPGVMVGGNFHERRVDNHRVVRVADSVCFIQASSGLVVVPESGGRRWPSTRDIFGGGECARIYNV
jgi:hypothetical protein